MALVDYGPLSSAGGFRATVSDTPGYGMGAGGGGEDLSWLMASARRRAEQKLRQGDLEVAAQEQALRAAARGPAPDLSRNMGGNMTPFEAQKQMLAMRDLRAQVDARTRPAPAQYVPGYAGHSVGHYQVDPTFLNYYQRQAYLPQSNTIAPSDPMDQVRQLTGLGVRG